jgi:hypothetical protein
MATIKARAVQMQFFSSISPLQLRIKKSRVRGEVLYQMHCGARPFFSFSIFAESRIQEI